MDDFKISLFEEEYKIEFPTYKTLSKDECNKLLGAVCQVYKLDQRNFENDLSSKQIYYGNIDNPDSAGIISILQDIGCNFLNEVYINWYKFERVDTLHINDLNKYFYDIWFPSSDDIDLLDDSLNWLISIRHDGCVTFTKNSI